jgi:RNA polymerase sigma factor (sigma-70 family)
MSNEELAVRIKAGETSLYSQLWTQCERFFRKKAFNYYSHNRNRADGAGQTIDDFYNSCFFVMMNAVQGYDPESGYTFLTFCKFPMKNVFRSLIGSRTRRKEPLNDCKSLDEIVPDSEGETSFVEMTADPESLTPFEEMSAKNDNVILRSELEAALDTLPEREADIIRRHYFEGIPVTQTAAQYGFSRKYAYDLERRGLDSLRAREEIERYHDFVISREAYKHTGLKSWRTSGVSSVERAVEKAQEELRAFMRKFIYETENFIPKNEDENKTCIQNCIQI